MVLIAKGALGTLRNEKTQEANWCEKEKRKGEERKGEEKRKHRSLWKISV